ncbi:MAG: LysM peptidoglycan-binding domain-containing protein [Anaerolineae bacterium]|nr:LysM peptidoglycan-binding domain-containing protein [Anaerolineae bacterium]
MENNRARQWLVFLLSGCLLVAAMPAYAQEPAPTHTVAVGENLFRIALQYGVSVDVLAAANNIVNIRTIYTGQVLVIPGSVAEPAPEVPESAAEAPQAEANLVEEVPPAPTPAESVAPQVHIVQAGETLASIARRYNVNWAQIASLNGLANPNHIVSGQQLIINGATVAAEEPAPAPAAPAPAEVAAEEPAPAAEAAPPQPV